MFSSVKRGPADRVWCEGRTWLGGPSSVPASAPLGGSPEDGGAGIPGRGLLRLYYGDLQLWRTRHLTEEE